MSLIKWTVIAWRGGVALLEVVDAILLSLHVKTSSKIGVFRALISGVTAALAAGAGNDPSLPVFQFFSFFLLVLLGLMLAEQTTCSANVVLPATPPHLASPFIGMRSARPVVVLAFDVLLLALATRFLLCLHRVTACL